MRIKQLLILSIAACTLSCDKKNSNLVEPLSTENFPQVIVFDDEGAGEPEDSDEFDFTLTLTDRPDQSGKELAGTKVPLKEDVIVSFEVKESEGIGNLADYIKDATALYEIDDCTTSEDKGIDLNLIFNATTGKGSVRFPKGVTEIEVVFETDEDLLNDGVINTDERSITIVITGVQASTEKVAFNKAQEFKYEVLDNQSVHGDWELDHTDVTSFAAFKDLFGKLNEDIADLSANDVEKIVISVEFDEVAIVIELKETESITECGSTEIVNKTIELEADLEELSLLTDEGDIEFVGEIEQSDNTVKEFVYKGGFKVVHDELTIVLVGEYDEEETDEITLFLKK